MMMELSWKQNLIEFERQQGWEAEGIDLNDPEAFAAAMERDPLPEPEKFNLSVPRSRCPNCGNLFGPSAQAVVGILFTWALVALTMIDFDHQLLPDSITLPLVWFGLLVNLGNVFTDIQSAVIGAALGYLILWGVFHLFKLITGKEGMGYGDFKLLAAIGALLGWQVLPMVILLSSLVGAVVGVAIIVISGRDKNIPIPFGPYLAAAAWIAMIWGDPITNAYFNLLGG